MSVRSMLAILLLTLPVHGFAESLATLAEARKVADQAVARFREEKIVEGFGVLKPYWPIAAVELDNLAHKTKTQWPLATQRFGASVGVEFIRERKAGDSLTQYTYLQKFQKHAIRWVFVFYKAQDRWVVNGVSFDDNVAALFQD